MIQIDQEQLLEDARKTIKEYAFYMNQAIEDIKLKDALKNASLMLNPLKTNDLTPKNYYLLFVQVFDEMKQLEAAFRTESKRGRKMSDLYENVQMASDIIPRLYLLITVASVFISSGEVPAQDLMSDIMEMMKGIQNPLKGLFLRYYFLKMCKDRFPDKEDEDHDESMASIIIIINNLNEMNKLWIRLTPSNKDKGLKEKERNDLKVIIGENIVRLSQLEGCTIEVYKNFVFDRLMEIVMSKEDSISQQYIIDCLIQAFPEEYHIAVLDKLLRACSVIIENKVDVKTIISRLMDRLANYISTEEELREQLTENDDFFKLFRSSLDFIIENQQNSIDVSKFLELEVVFLKFCLNLYGGNPEYVNAILKSCCNLCQKGSQTFDTSYLNSIVQLLTLPLSLLSFAVLEMDEFPKLMNYLPFLKRRTVAINLCKTISSSNILLDRVETLKQIIRFIAPLLIDQPDSSEIDAYEFSREQQSVAGLVHLIYHKNPDKYFEILEEYKNELYKGGEKRTFYTLPSLFHAYIKIARYLKNCQIQSMNPNDDENEEDQEEDQKKASRIYDVSRQFYKGQTQVNFAQILKIMREIIEKLGNDHLDLSLKLYLDLANCISYCDSEKALDEETYSIFSHILDLYQNEIVDSDLKVTLLSSIGNTLYFSSCLGEDNHEALAENITSYSTKLLKKFDQGISILNCTHFFCCQTIKNDARILESFKKVYKICDAIFNTQPNDKNFHLYVSCLNKMLYYFNNHDIAGLSADDINKFIQTLKSKLQNNPQVKCWYFENTLKYIQSEKLTNSKLALIEC